MATVSNVQLKIQTGTDRTVIATWDWDKSNTDNYKVIWYYDTGDGVWFKVDEAETKEKYATYNAPTNAKSVKFKVKPVSKKHTVKKKKVSYWTADWSTLEYYYFTSNPPVKPSAPNVTIEEYTLTATLDNIDLNATTIEFQICRNNLSVFRTIKANITNRHASVSCSITTGNEYKVRCRSYRDGLWSEYSDYSENQKTIPSTPEKIITCRASSETSVYLAWSAVPTATSYDIEYATKITYFDESNQTITEGGIETTQYDLTGMATGDEYFFRVRAVNEKGESGWSEIRSTIIGSKPSSPTTWSSTTTAIVGENLTLYWIHNSKDGSHLSMAEVKLTVDGVEELHVIQEDENAKEEELANKTYTFPVNTSDYPEGTSILWSVRTAGVTKEYGDWSIERKVDIYAPPTLEMTVTNRFGIDFDTLDAFPINVNAIAGPNTQSPINYHLTVIANEAYETVDDIGNVKMVNKGETIYSNHFDISTELETTLSASDVDFENNIRYTIACTVTMNSGLTAESSRDFTVEWVEVSYEPDAEIGIDEDNLSAYIRPYCTDLLGQLVEGVTLSVYRREFDGGFTEIVKNIANLDSTFVVDPHPALDYARYRIVAVTESTGAVSYYDVPGYPVEEKSVVIQWSEEWSNFDSTGEDDLEEPTWSGSLLKLPYNIDISDSHSADVSLIEYIGRKHPVSYYGTQVGHKSTWNMVIEKDDEETLYALRRLAIWMGDVYVREPSGSGYWASVSVSFGQKHLDLTIPVTLDIVRVEGGI